MERDPALIIRLVDVGSVLHQEGHHVHIVIYACLWEERKARGEIQISVCAHVPDLMSVAYYSKHEKSITHCDSLPHAPRIAEECWQLWSSQKACT